MAAAKAGAVKTVKATPARGGFGIGLVVGLLIGLAVALGVALYITKAPIPFVNKLPQRTAEQDAAEAERNKNWDPNAPLGGKGATPRAAAASADPAGAAQAGAASPAAPPAPTAPVPPVTAPNPAPPTAAAPPAGNAAQPQAHNPAAAASAATARAPAASATGTSRDPAAILAGQAGGAPAAKAASFFVQAGAYANPDDAEAQRARLAMSGFTAKVMAREQSGKTVYRVRLGPFDERDAADDLRDKLGAAGVESTLVRVER